MFSGIVKDLGRISFIDQDPNEGGLVIGIDCSSFEEKVNIGDSVAVNGVCLTVTKMEANIFHFDVWKESLLRTNLADLGVGQEVHLELALKFGERVGGHPLSGHIDYIAKILEITKVTDSSQVKIWLSFPKQYDKLIPLRGSIGLSGVSLTITDKREGAFAVSLIPETLRQTFLSDSKVGDTLNIETDFQARNVGDSNRILNRYLPNELYPSMAIENDNYQCLSQCYEYGLPIILEDEGRYYFVLSIKKMRAESLQFILSLSHNRCTVSCSSFISDRLNIPAPSINTNGKPIRRQLVPISHCENDSFEYSYSAIAKTAQLFLDDKANLTDWKTPGVLCAVQTSHPDYSYQPTAYEASVELAREVEKEDSTLCIQIYDSMGQSARQEDIIDLALRYKLPFASIKVILEKK